MSNHETLRLQVFSVLVRPTTAFQPRRLMMAPAAVGCKRLLDGSYAHIGAREGKHAPTIKGSGTPDFRELPAGVLLNSGGPERQASAIGSGDAHDPLP